MQIQLEVVFLTNEDRKGLYKSYDRKYVEQRVVHNHSKVPTLYCSIIFRNILMIHLLIAFYSNPDPKYLTSGTQQHFVLAPRDCIA